MMTKLVFEYGSSSIILPKDDKIILKKQIRALINIQIVRGNNSRTMISSVTFPHSNLTII